MELNTHYSGRIARALERTLSKSSGRSGKFYEIFNKFGFYDVNDEKNGLTPEQRRQVPPENQTRFTQFSNAISEMFNFVLGDDENGMLTVTIQDIIDKLDIRSSANSAELNAIGSTFSAVAAVPVIGQILSTADGSRRAMEAQVTAVMGSNPFDPDLIPPIAIGLDGLPTGVANVYNPGFFQPNWSVLYNLEPVKSPVVYQGADGYPRIGANISLTENGKLNEMFLKSVFAVASVDKNLNPTGDVKGGLTADQYDTLKQIASWGNSSLSTSQTETKNAFRLTDAQMEASFNRYVQLKFWDVINNRNNWAHAHWGALTHNSMPEYVKTAVSSFVWSNGLALIPNRTDPAAFISYATTMGLNYLIGYNYTIKMYGIAGMDKYINSSGDVITVTTDGVITADKGVPKDEAIAKRYFTLVADILVRLTSNTAGDDIAKQVRRRRVSEANIIYKGVGLPTIEYASAVSTLPYVHTEAGLVDRKFNSFMNATIYRYANEGSAGGSASNHELAKPENNSVQLDFSGISPQAARDCITPSTINMLKGIMDQAGVTYAYVTSTVRTPADQARAMFNNLQNNSVISYASKSTNDRGWGATLMYFSLKERNVTHPDNTPVPLSKRYGHNEPVTNQNDINTIKQYMTNYIDQQNRAGKLISRHCGDPNEIQVLDISPKMMRPADRKSAFEAICYKMKKDGTLKNFLTPADNDPAYHIEIYPSVANGSAPPQPNNKQPDVQFTMGNTNLKQRTAWLTPLSYDYVSNKTVV